MRFSRPKTAIRQKIRGLAFAVSDATFGQIVRRQLDTHLVTGHDSDEVLAHPARHVRHHFISGFQLNPKTSIRKCLCDSTFDFEGLFFVSQNSVL